MPSAISISLIRSRSYVALLFRLSPTPSAFALGFVENALGLGARDGGAGVLVSLYALVLLLPSLAVGARRLHDTGRSGWWLLIGLVPLIGSIVLIIFFVLDSQPGDNPYGPNPKGMLV